MIRDCLAAWEDRQQRIKTMACRWKEQRVYAPGSVVSPDIAKEMELTGPIVETGVPSVEQRLDASGSLITSGKLMRFESPSTRTDKKGEVRLETFVSSYDGESSRLLFTPTQGVGRPRGGIRKPNHNDNVASISAKPLLMFARPTSPGFAQFHNVKLELIDAAENLDGHQCILLANQSDRIWVDPECAYVVRQWLTHGNNDRVVMKVNVEYVADELLGWRPSAWTLADAVFGRDMDHAKIYFVEVADIQFNATISDGAFQLEFPPDAEVYDDKSKRFVHDDARIESERLTSAVSRKTRIYLVVLGNLCLIIAIVLFIAIRRRK